MGCAPYSCSTPPRASSSRKTRTLVRVVTWRRGSGRLVPEDDSLYTHTAEGPDDMPAHVKSALTATSLGVPVASGRLALGTWQGIYLWEHRHRGGARRVLVHVS